MRTIQRPGGDERRRQRSEDTHTALSLKLAQLKQDAQLSAVVLATSDGLSIAHAGDDVLCSELAAVAPLLSTERVMPNDMNFGQGLMHVRAVTWRGFPLYLAATSSTPAVEATYDVSSHFAEAEQGVARILAA